MLCMGTRDGSRSRRTTWDVDASTWETVARAFDSGRIKVAARRRRPPLCMHEFEWVLSRLLRVANRRSDLLSVQMHASVGLPSFATLARPVQHPLRDAARTGRWFIWAR